MRKVNLFLIFAFCILHFAFFMLSGVEAHAQAPQAFKYQAVVRNTSGGIVASQSVALRISILRGSDAGTPVYVETHTATTNEFGLVNLAIGNGAVASGQIDTIAWGSNAYYIKIELDITGSGASYSDMGASQLLSVPYALYAGGGTTGPEGPQGPAGNNGISINWQGSLPSAPASPLLNDAYYNMVNKKSYIYNGTAWSILAQDGAAGAQGNPGSQGQQGPIGPQGPAGTGLNNMGEWLSGSQYISGDYVFDQSSADTTANSMWICESGLAFTSNIHPRLDAANWAEFEAPAGPQGLQGPEGPQGLQGPAGNTGTQGNPGTNGADGSDGANGISIVWLGSFANAPGSPVLNQGYYNTTNGISFIWDGASWQIIAQDGSDGAPGQQGSIGPQGGIGPEGPQGPQGQAGVGLVNKGEWATGTQYVSGDYVFDQSSSDTTTNSMWICENTVTFTSLTHPRLDMANWVEFEAPAGPQGPAGQQGAQGTPGQDGSNGQNGISLTWLGTFAVAPSTPSLNSAYYNSVSKKSYVWNGTVWQIMTQDGADGATGTTGNTGPAGPAGPAGTYHAGTGISISGDTLYNILPNAAHTGDVTGSSALTIANNAVTGSKIANNSVDGSKIAMGSDASGDVLYYNGTDYTRLAKGSDGAVLKLSSGLPAWGTDNGLTTALTSLNGLSGATQIFATGAAGSDFNILSTGTTHQFNIPVASSSVSGKLSSADWSTFNGKLGTSLTSGNIWIGNTSNVATATSLSGDATLSGTGVFTIADNAVDGSDIALGSDASGDIMYYNGTDYVRLPKGTDGKIMKLVSGLPAWNSESISAAGTGLSLSNGTLNSVWTLSGNNIYNNNTRNVGIGINAPSGKLVVQGDSLAAGTDPLFEVKDKAGNTVFVVYPDSVHIFVKADASKATAQGGFAVSGRSSSKSAPDDYLVVTPNSTQVNTGDPELGFNVGDLSGGTSAGYMKLTPENYFIGHEAGKSITSGQYNSFLGYQSGANDNSGNNNTFLGYLAGYSNTGGNSNVFMGDSAGFANQSGSLNVFLGSQAGRNNVGGSGAYGCYNVFVGKWAGYANTEGYENTFIGKEAGFRNTSGYDNTFIGTECGHDNTSGLSNIYIGYRSGPNKNALEAPYPSDMGVGMNNICLGNNSGVSITYGNDNSFIGSNAGFSNTSGGNNIFYGNNSGYSNTSGTYNIFQGNQSGKNNIDGSFNLFLGYQAGYSSNGSQNIFLGYWSGKSNLTGSDNLFMGLQSGMANTSGNSNVFLGNLAGHNNTEANNNVFIGYGCGEYNTTGAQNTYIGYKAGNNNTQGGHNINIGSECGLYATGGSSNVFLGDYSGSSNSGNNNVFIGLSSGYTNGLGEDNIFLGSYSGYSNTNGIHNTYLGVYAGYMASTGSKNIFIGDNSGRNAAYGDHNVFLGVSTGFMNTADNNVFIGSDCGYANTYGTNNVFLGTQAGYSNATGSNNVFLGNKTGISNTDGANNVFIGDNAGLSNTTGQYNVFIGQESGKSNIGGSSWTEGGLNVFLGYQSGYSNTMGAKNIGIGYQSFYHNVSGRNNVSIGTEALFYNISGEDNTGIGMYALQNNSTGAGNVALGSYAMQNNTTGNANVGIGGGSLQANDDGESNTGIGINALTWNYNGNFNTATGRDAMYYMSSGSYNVSFGYRAMRNNTSGSYNTAMGSETEIADGMSNSLALGNGATITASNVVQLGNWNIEALFCRGAYQATTSNAANLYVDSWGQIMRSTSSKRYKKDIKDLEINTVDIYKLRPVSYTSINDNKRYFGLIAEEVALTIPQLADYAVEKEVIKGSTSTKLIPDAVKYPMLSVLLLSEVQKHEAKINELTKIIENLKAENAGLKNQDDEINKLKAEIESIKTSLGYSTKR